jgi:putative salt-induced outer membrane protein YdiY
MKQISVLLFMLLFTVSSIAQVADSTAVEEPVEKKSNFDRNKLYYGGYVNASFGNYTVIGAAPLVGYKVTPKFSVGGQVTYEYVKDKRYSTDYETSNYGLSVFSRFRVVPQLYLHAEFSEMNYKLYRSDGGSKREWVPFLWLGGGYSQPVTRNTWLTAQVLFDVINNENSPYKNWEPYFSVGIGVGF